MKAKTMSMGERIAAIQEEMEKCGIQPKNGLGEELFLFASTLMPVVNVDLLITDKKGRILLSWRDDPHCGTGWHVPGGCVRFRETLLERAHKTAMREFGYHVEINPQVLHTFEIFSREERQIEDQNQRAHFITFVMSGCISEEFDINTQRAKPGEPGYLRWFEDLPGDLLQIQDCYYEQWNTIKMKLRG